MKFAQLQNRKIAYQQEGKGPTVVLLHGFCENQMMWEDFSRDLIEEGFRVITIELPGFGQSEPGDQVTISYYAEAVKEVCNALNLDRPVIIGHSMGGYTALAYAEKYPDNLAGLSLFHSHPYADSEEKKQARHKQIEFIQKHGHQLYVKQVIPTLFAEGYASSRPFDVDKFIYRASQGPEQGIRDALKAMADRPDRSQVLATLSCPVQYIIGKEDRTAPAEYFTDMLPLAQKSDIHILDKVGHMGMIESRQKTQLMVRRFVELCYRE